MPFLTWSYPTCAMWGCHNQPTTYDRWCSWHVATTNGDIPFAALRGAGEDDGQQDDGDDDRQAVQDVDGPVGEGAHTHSDAPIQVGDASEGTPPRR